MSSLEHQLPTWVQYVAALGPLLIGVSVAFIAFRQWRTEHQRVVLDLFERRIAIYEQLEAAAVLVISGTEEKVAEGQRLANSAFRDAKFLFGDEAFARINEFYKAISGFEYVAGVYRMYDDDRPHSQKKDLDNANRLQVIEKFLREMPNIFERYLRMKQRL